MPKKSRWCNWLFKDSDSLEPIHSYDFVVELHSRFKYPQVFKNTNVHLFSQVFGNVADVESEKLLAITSLAIGILLLILAGYSVGSVPHNYTLDFVEIVLGCVFIVLALGTLVPMYAKKPENRKSITMLFVGIELIIAGANLMMFTLISIRVFPLNWWIFTLTGAVLFIIGIFLTFRSRVYRASLDCWLTSTCGFRFTVRASGASWRTFI